MQNSDVINHNLMHSHILVVYGYTHVKHLANMKLEKYPPIMNQTLYCAIPTRTHATHPRATNHKMIIM